MNTELGFELPFIISTIGLLIWILGKFPKIISWPFFVVFVCMPYVAKISINDYSGSKPYSEFWIRFIAFSVILGGIAWAFVKIYVQNVTQDQSLINSAVPDIEGFGDKTISINNKFFVKAWEELESENVHKGVWARALSASEGDEEKAKAIYIRLRVKELVAKTE